MRVALQSPSPFAAPVDIESGMHETHAGRKAPGHAAWHTRSMQYGLCEHERTIVRAYVCVTVRVCPRADWDWQVRLGSQR